jgi:NitT/TauT family transport system substrate-binding protein
MDLLRQRANGSALTLPRRALVLLPTAGLLAACSERAPTPARSGMHKVTYLTSFGSFGRDAYVYVAAEKGFFRDAGIQVVIKPGTGTDGVKYVATGEADFCAVDFPGGLLQVVNGGLEVRVIALIQQQSLAAIMAPQSSGISTPSDLVGKSIADIPASTVKLLFPTYAKLATPAFDPTTVRWVNSSAPGLVSLLGTNKVDAISQFVVGEPTVEAASRFQVNVLPYSAVIGDLVGNALWVSNRLATQNPHLVRAFRKALLQGLRYAIDHPGEAGEILAKAVPTTKQETAGLELFLMRPYVGGTNIGRIDGQRIARLIAILQGAAAIPSGVVPEQLVNFGLADSA